MIVLPGMHAERENKFQVMSVRACVRACARVGQEQKRRGRGVDRSELIPMLCDL